MASSPKNKTVSSARAKNKSALVNPENTTAQSYQEIIETVGVVIWRAPVNSFQYTYINPEAERLFGYPVEECLEEGFWESIIHPSPRGSRLGKRILHPGPSGKTINVKSEKNKGSVFSLSLPNLKGQE